MTSLTRSLIRAAPGLVTSLVTRNAVQLNFPSLFIFSSPFMSFLFRQTQVLPIKNKQNKRRQTISGARWTRSLFLFLIPIDYWTRLRYYTCAIVRYPPSIGRLFFWPAARLSFFLTLMELCLLPFWLNSTKRINDNHKWNRWPDLGPSNGRKDGLET